MTAGVRVNVPEGPKLKRLDSGAVTTEANLNIGEAHVYNRHRFSRNDWQNIKYVWNVMEVRHHFSAYSVRETHGVTMRKLTEREPAAACTISRALRHTGF